MLSRVRNGFHFSGSDVLKTTGNFFLPRGIRICINNRVKAVDQGACKLSPFFIGQSKQFFDVLRNLAHEADEARRSL